MCRSLPPPGASSPICYYDGIFVPRHQVPVHPRQLHFFPPVTRSIKYTNQLIHRSNFATFRQSFFFFHAVVLAT